ncbi:hypothetical protein EI427_21150 [Flammeovirga pectinis]|uniref:Uncharacterized protein n=1 Tax=Flammeovirga pectinis TaxID=2494373 RepID=A0A3S9P993_9BACT|nr:hypothetical protein [Flammeovirga pectinis]AZQ64734.1 hypothetical protein EI427_21150 [Flammeovirga pectinis]
METSTILYIILGISVFLLLFQKKWIDKNAEYDSYSDEKNEWSILTSFSELKILSKYAGELRFGPAYIHIKTEPKNVFGEEFYGDWFYRIENGIYLQQWNSNPIKSGVHTRANNDLIFYDRIKNQREIIETGIKSFHWKIEKDNNKELTLISNNGKSETRIKITNANN